MYLDSLRADLRADLHILLDNHDFTEVFLRNLPRQRNSVCGFWVCEMVEQVMQAVRNPLAMPAPLRFGNCWPPEEHLVNKWRGFMALSSLEHLVAYEERLVIALSSDEGEDE